MIKLAYIERNIEYAIEYVKARKKGLEYESLLTYITSALDELRKAKPMKESGEVTCSDGICECQFLRVRHFGTDTCCAASPNTVSVFYGEDRYLVPCKDCVWK